MGWIPAGAHVRVHKRGDSGLREISLQEIYNESEKNRLKLLVAMQAQNNDHRLNSAAP